MPETLSTRPELRFWGWGAAHEHLTGEETESLRGLVASLAQGEVEEVQAPTVEEISLRPPRIDPPQALKGIASASAYDRLTHAYGKSYPDGLRMMLRDVPNPPDWVLFPQSEEDLARIFDWAAAKGVAVVPFGGGSSVCGGVEPDVGDGYEAVVSVDLERLSGVKEIDRESRVARIAGGTFGPELEAALRPDGLTLRHFPQSFQYSTLGGWIATRSGGHYASLYTHIDDFVEATRTVTPEGPLETRRLPGSGAGPDPDRLVIGSEGILGIITEAWVRLQDRPKFRGSASVAFPDMTSAVSAVRALSQSALFPTNCRLLDPVEVAVNRVGDGKSPTLVLGFESADHPLEAWMARALELVQDHGGHYDADAVARSLASPSVGGEKAAEGGEHRKGAAGAWRNAFLRMPYYRNLTNALGMIMDTFETAVTWDGFESLYAGVRERVGTAIREATGTDALVSCRFTHVYPDGPAPYFSFFAMGSGGAHLADNLDRWRAIKAAANAAVCDLGGTATHHHAVGRDHRPGAYDREVPDLFRKALQGAKTALDPAGVLNPGVLIDPAGRPLGGRGVMQPG